MKKVFLMLAIMGICDSFAQDTIQVELNEKAKVIVTAQDRESLLKLRSINFNKIIKESINRLDTTFDKNKETAKEKEGKTWILFGTDFRTEEGFKIFQEIKDERKGQLQPVNQSWVLDLGWNNYLENGSFPDANNAPYRLQTFNSVYVGVGSMWLFRLGGEKSPISLRTGIMADWYNFRFFPQNYISADENGVVFGNYEQDFGQSIRKSKLVVPYLQIPLMLRFRVPVHKQASIKIGLGGYAGLRMGGRTKVNIGDERIREKDSYYLSNWRYGLEANVGINEFTLFCKYDLNPLFVENKGPKLNAISFGVRL
jgi:hypothetical protein